MSFHVPDFSKCRVLVVGDVMLDRYWTGDTSRISPEAPVPVVHIQDLQDRAGGAANVALNVASLNANVQLLGIVGKDEAADKLDALLNDSEINSSFERLDQCSTITKLRVLSRHQQLMRLDFEDDSLMAGGEALAKQTAAVLTKADVVVLSDYAKGSLNGSLKIINAARQASKPVIVDPKGTDFGKYQGATLLTPNESEFESIVGKCDTNEEIVSRANILIDQLNLTALLITRSEKGMVLVEQGQQPFFLSTQARDVFDVTGAGDTVVGVLAAAIAAGESLQSAANLANIAAGIVVSKLGAQSVSVAELEAERQHGDSLGNGVITEEDLMAKVSQCKAQGEKVVFTNGCFDLLHNGHITYLNEAAHLGDKLIVAVNDDASVVKLKGDKRPINSLSDRMAMLAALRCVDWVVSFSEDTPQRLIGRLLPDVLVKGGDYKVSEIAGAEKVEKNGGQVKVLSFKEGYSSTDMIERIKEI